MITLKTLPEASAQQVFDQVAIHLLTQQKQSLNEVTECVYRGPNGLQCAAGCLISDDEYKPEWETLGWYTLSAVRHVVPEAHRELIENLQDIHDICDPSAWKTQLEELAYQHNLSPEVLQHDYPQNA